MTDETTRALRAYFRGAPSWIDQRSNGSGPVDLDGRRYVVLRNVNRVVAVYRVNAYGALRRQHEWPEALETFWAVTPSAPVPDPRSRFGGQSVRADRIRARGRP